MKRLLVGIVLILGVWLAISPWMVAHHSTLAQWNDWAVGLVIICVSLVIILRKSDPAPRWPFFVNSLLGLWLIIGTFALGETSTTNRWNDIIVGILIAVFSIIATQVTEGQKSHIYSKDGKVLLELASMTYKDRQIELKGKLFGSTPSTFCFRPLDLWHLIGFVPFIVIRNLPRMLVAGWKASNVKTTKGDIKH